MSCNPNYPTNFPGECVASAIVALKSGNIGGAIDGGYVVLGYGLGIVRSTVLVGEREPIVPEQVSQLQELRDLLDDGPAMTGDVASQLLAFWRDVLAPQLKELLELILAGLN